MFSSRLLSIGTFALATVLACSSPALAQAAPQAQAAPIEQQMTAEQFKAAGLDKLSAAELANLNAWLNHAIVAESTKAAEFATQKVKTENRGFFDFGSEEPIDGRLVGEFRGFSKSRTYTLENGQVWQQIDDTHMSVRPMANPDVRIKPAMMGNSWYMAVGKYNTRAQVKRIK
jgi:hypothetical protein